MPTPLDVTEVVAGHRPRADQHAVLVESADPAVGDRGEWQGKAGLVSLHRERARRGDRNNAIPVMRAAVDHLVPNGQLLMYGVPATGVLVETLLDNGADGDVAEAETAIERLAAAPADEGLVIRDIWLLRLRALLARARGDDVSYRDFRDRYRDMARTLGFEGHIEWAEAMQ